MFVEIEEGVWVILQKISCVVKTKSGCSVKMDGGEVFSSSRDASDLVDELDEELESCRDGHHRRHGHHEDEEDRERGDFDDDDEGDFGADEEDDEGDFGGDDDEGDDE